MVAAKIPGIIPLGGTLTWNNSDHQPFSVAKHNIPEILTNQNQPIKISMTYGYLKLEVGIKNIQQQ